MYYLTGGPLFVAFISVLIAAAVYAVLMLLARHVIPDKILAPHLVKFIMRSIRPPLLSLLALVTVQAVLSAAAVPYAADILRTPVFGVLQTAVLAWLAIRCVAIARGIITNAFDTRVSDNLSARKVHTQMRVIEQVAVSIIVIIALALVLMSFDKVRQLGITLLASAGVFGIIMGFAAQKTIATLFAGIQIAITQPIRVDDVVIVEGEWGWIEEITLTYVVVKVWDLRRLVVPISLFIERSFQNWTRVSADILGTVFIYADYTLPFEGVRAELKRICEASQLWDRKVCGLQITDATSATVEMRALVSAKDSPSAWDLRCLVREKLIEFIKANYPESLPRTRVSMES